MSYVASETARHAGDPAELYRFATPGQCWHYTSADTPIVYQGETYYPAVIRRGHIQQTDEGQSGSVEVSVSGTLSVAERFVGGASPEPVGLTIIRLHRSDGDAEGVVHFTGTVLSASFAGGEAVLRCVSTQAALARPIPRTVYQRLCNNVLYDEFCGLSANSWKALGTVTAVDGLTVTTSTAASFGAGYFTAGYVRIEGERQTAFVLQHDAAGDLALMTPLSGLAVGVVLEMYAGCDHTVETCNAKFANLVHFFGFPEIPQINPFRSLV